MLTRRFRSSLANRSLVGSRLRLNPSSSPQRRSLSSNSEEATAVHSEALKQLDEGDLAKARLVFERAMSMGSVEATFFCGLDAAGALGEDAVSDMAKAVGLYLIAADQGHVASMFNLGLAYRLGQGVEVDHEKALKWYREAAEEGDPRAAFSLGLTLDPHHHPEMDLGLEPDGDLAQQWYQTALEAGHARAGVNLGILHWHPVGFEMTKREQKDRRETAMKLWREAADAGVYEARDCLRQAADVDED